MRAEIQEHALTFEAPCPTVRKTHLDRPGRDEAALAQDELEPIGCEPRRWSAIVSSTIARLRRRTPAMSVVAGPARWPNAAA